MNIHQFSKYLISVIKEMTECLKILHEDLSELIKIAQNQQIKYYNTKHKCVEYQVGEKVWFLSQNIHIKRFNKKLNWKRFDSYPIIEKIDIQMYKLQLFSFMKIHLIFHISLLKQFIESDIPNHIQLLSLFIIIKNQIEYEMKDILDFKILYKYLFYLYFVMLDLFSIWYNHIKSMITLLDIISIWIISNLYDIEFL